MASLLVILFIYLKTEEMKRLFTSALLLGSAAGFAQVQVDGDMFIGPGVEVHVFEDVTNTGDFNINNTALLHVRGDINMEGTAQQNIGGHVIVDKLHQDNGSGVVVANGSQVEVYEALELNTGTMTANAPVIMKSLPAWTAYVDDFSSGFGGGYSGDLTMERYVSTSGFHHMGGAVDVCNIATELSEAALYGPNMGQVIPLPDCNPNAIDGTSPYGNLFEWDENAPFLFSCNQSGWYVRSTGGLDNGRGYSLTFPGGSTFDLTGAPHMSTVTTAPLANSGGLGNGFHLVTNPYPCDIEWAAMVPGFDAAIYVWQSSGSYAGTYIPSFPWMGTRIASQQAFFTRRSSGSGSFSIPLSSRRTGSSTYFREAAHQGLEIIVKNDDHADRAVVNFDPMASITYESDVDAMKVRHTNGQPLLATTNGYEDLSVNTLDIDNTDEIPLVFTTATSGEYSFEFNTEEEGFWLEDRKLDRYQPLGSGYDFVWEEDDLEDRFIIHYRLADEVSSNDDEENIVIFITEGDLMVQGANEGTGLIQMYDMTGRSVWNSNETLSKGSNRIELPNMALGQYLIRVRTDRSTVSIKSILN